MPASILPASWQIPEKIRNRLGRGAGRQRAMIARGASVAGAACTAQGR